MNQNLVGASYRALLWHVFTHNISVPLWSEYVRNLIQTPIAGYTSKEDLTKEIGGKCRCKICVSDRVKLDKHQ